MSFENPDFNGAKRHTKLILLPSGKVIEVIPLVPVDELMIKPEAAEAPDQNAAPEGGLHICQDCDSHLVYPTDWEEEGDKWCVELHCPNCDWVGGGTYDQDILDELDEELDRGMEDLASDLGRLARMNMADDVDRFVAALNADAIQPMDF